MAVVAGGGLASPASTYYLYVQDAFERTSTAMTEQPDNVRPARAHDILGSARDWIARDGKVAIATVVDTWGSAPVPVGGQLAIATDGTFEGSVSGGCIEGEVLT